jgi:NADPH:quinone reductase and related Zn-dependent oxidoreductases
MGSILIQLTKKLTSLKVVATASRPEAIEWTKKMGVNFAIDHRKSIDQETKRIGIPNAL